MNNNNLLIEWFNFAKFELVQKDFKLKITNMGDSPIGASITIDGPNFVGGICHWMPDIFEFLFYENSTGNEILLETANFDNILDLNKHIDLILKKLENKNT